MSLKTLFAFVSYYYLQIKNVKYSVLIIVFLIISTHVFSQNIEQWWAYQSLRTVNDVTIDNYGAIWGATSGGVIKIDKEGYKSFSTLDGLSNQYGTVIINDEYRDRIFIGYGDGRIDIVEINDNSISTLEDIVRAENYTSKGINDFEIYEQNLYVATDFGIVVIDLDGMFVKESYLQIGSINRGAIIFDIKIRENTIYTATERGIGIGNLSDDLVIQNNWIVHNSESGFVSEQIMAVGLWGDDIVASTSEQNYVYDGNSWQVDDRFEQNRIIKYISTDLYIASSEKGIFYSENGEEFNYKGVSPARILSIGSTIQGDSIYFGTLNEGIGVFNIEEQATSYFTPEGPYKNLFDGLTVDNGILIASSSQKSAGSLIIDDGKGYYIYADGEWENFNKKTNNTLNANDFRHAFTSTVTDEYYYFGSWGYGVAKHNKETDSIDVYNSSNSILRGYEDDNDQYVVISGLDADSDDNVWLVSRFGSRPLYYQEKGEDSWQDFPKHSAASGEQYVKLFIDSFDQKWITLQNNSAAGRGVLVLDTGKNDTEADDKAVRLTTNAENGNLPDPQVKAIIEDYNGEVWVGTQRGIARFIFPEFIIDGNASERQAQWLINEDTTANSRYLLRDVNVSTMAVNGANEKWIGTENQGIFVVNEDGSRIIKRYTADNSPLNSNNILSIAVNDVSGEVFIATVLGLMSYMDIPKEPKQEMEELKVFPNPFNYSNHSQIVIDGLAESTTVKILGIDGNVVNEISARGGRISWDALDYSGQQLGSGVYFVVAYQEDGKSRGLGKVVIIR